MAGEADLRIPVEDAFGVELPAVRADPEAAQLGMALQAVSLPVTARTALKGLPGRLSVPKYPQGLGVMERGPEPAPGAEALLPMTVLAEAGRVMAVGALQGLPESVGGVA